jgi:flagellar basal body-associated protein FliL
MIHTAEKTKIILLTILITAVAIAVVLYFIPYKTSDSNQANNNPQNVFPINTLSNVAQ